MIRGKVNRVISMIRFQHFELFKILIDLIKKMDIYKLKFIIGYVTTYLEEYLELCEYRQQVDPKAVSLADEFEYEQQIKKKDTYEIAINNNIFYSKIG